MTGRFGDLGFDVPETKPWKGLDPHISGNDASAPPHDKCAGK